MRWIDPYGAYHAERDRYATRPSATEPHIVIEYRQLVPKLDKDTVRRLRCGFYLPRQPAVDEPPQVVTEAERAEADAVAAAAADAAAAAVDAANKSGAIVDRFKDEDFFAHAKKSGGPGRFSVDPICLEPMVDDSDDDSMHSVELTMANSFLNYKVHRHRSQIPRDYIDLQRHFAAQHPTQTSPLSVERADGAVILPWDKQFDDGETIVFREFTLDDDDVVQHAKPRARDWQANLPPRSGAFDWERDYADWAQRRAGKLRFVNDI